MDAAQLQQGLALYLILVGSISIHEFAHAYAADKIGDPTPRNDGRVTLNPLAHIDIIGTVILPLFMILLSPGFAIFGWGKPVLVDPRYFRKPVRDDLIVTGAGPLSNIIIATVTAIVGGLLFGLFPSNELAGFLMMVLQLNILLVVFNLIPIPPLDGSHFLKHAIGMTDETFLRLSQWGFVIILVLINIPPFRWLLGTLIQIGMTPFIFILETMSRITG